MCKTIGAIWFTQHGDPAPIGIVICETTVGKIERKAYIGMGNGYALEEHDIEHIKSRGAKLHKETLKDILKMLETKGDDQG